LKRKVIRAIQLTISEDPNHPEEVIESWTFSIDYTHPGNGVLLNELSVQSKGSAPITVKRAKHAMQTFQRLLVTLCSGLPSLPGKFRFKRRSAYMVDRVPFRAEVLKRSPVLY